MKQVLIGVCLFLLAFAILTGIFWCLGVISLHFNLLTRVGELWNCSSDFNLNVTTGFYAAAFLMIISCLLFVCYMVGDAFVNP